MAQDRLDRRIGREGWTRNGYTALDLTTRAVTILRDADAALGRDHDATRIRAWSVLLRDSSYTPAGQARLRRRLGLSPESGRAA